MKRLKGMNSVNKLFVILSLLSMVFFVFIEQEKSNAEGNNYQKKTSTSQGYEPNKKIRDNLSLEQKTDNIYENSTIDSGISPEEEYTGNTESILPMDSLSTKTIPIPTITYEPHISYEGWRDGSSNGGTAGSTSYNDGNRFEAIRISLSNIPSGLSGGVAYSTYGKGAGLLPEASDWGVSGTTGQTRPLEAVKIRLTGSISSYYSVEYRTYSSKKGYGWTDWMKDNEVSGYPGAAIDIKAMQVRLVPKLFWGNVPWEFNETSGVLTFTGTGTLGTYTSSPWNRTDVFRQDSTKIKKIVFTKSVSAPTNSDYLFGYTSNSNSTYKPLVNMLSIEGLNYLNTSSAKTMMGMFSYASSLSSLNLNSFNTNNVTNMSYMFYNMNNLLSLNVNNFDTSSVTNMSHMFRNIPKLPNLNIANFNTGNVLDMSYMFSGLVNITSLDLNNFNTNKVTNMSYMFYNLPKLISLNIANFNTNNVLNMSYMFNGLTNMTKLNLNHFNTSKVTNMSYMFSNMSNLESIDLSEFDMVSKPTNIGYIFLNDKKLNRLTIGTKFRGNTGSISPFLPEITSDNTYTGKWILEDSETIGTSEEFMKNYDGSKPGTYIWEVITDSEITIKYHIFDGGKKPRSIFSDLDSRLRKSDTSDTVTKGTNIEQYVKGLISHPDVYTGYTYSNQYDVYIDNDPKTPISDDTFPTNQSIVLVLYFNPLLTIQGTDDINFGNRFIPKSEKEVFKGIPKDSISDETLQITNTYEVEDGTRFRSYQLIAMTSGMFNETTFDSLKGTMSYTTVEGQNIPIKPTGSTLFKTDDYSRTVILATNDQRNEGLQLSVDTGNSIGVYKGTIYWQLAIGP